jgi:hypothetical protein
VLQGPQPVGLKIVLHGEPDEVSLPDRASA